MSTVQVLIQDQGNRRAVSDLVSQRYDVETDTALASADLYLLDDRSLPEYRKQLRERKRQEGAVFCPVVLILREGTRVGKNAVPGLDSGGSTLIDEVLPAPLDQKTMVRRFDNLLTRRDTTKNLAQRNEQLEIRERELERYEAFIQESTDVVSTLSPDGIIQYLSPSIERVLGYETEALIGTSAFDLIHPEDRDTIREQFSELATRPGETVAVEGRFQDVDGEWCWLAVRATNQLENETIGAIVTNSRDITERKRGEQKRERTVSRMTDAILEVDQDWRLIEVNDQALELLDIDRERLLGTDLWETFPSAVESRFYDKYRTVMESREPVTFEERFETLDSWFAIDAYPEPHGGIAIYFRDISERKAREQRIERLNREFETVFENVRDALFLLEVEADGAIRVRRSNEYSERILGEPPVTAKAQTLQELLGARDRSELISSCRDCIDKRSAVFLEQEMTTPDGRSVFDIRLTPIVIDGDVQLIVGSAREITDRKRYEQRLESQRDDLQLLNQMVRHDIRNDLQVIRTHAELLETKVDDDARESVEKIVSGADSAITLTEEARELAEVMLRSGETHEPIGLAAILIEQIDQLRSTHETVHVDVPDSIPRIQVMANEMLDSVFGNLLHNSVLHNDRSEPEVLITTVSSDEAVEISIADNGPGIPDEMKASIFEKGHKGEQSEGSGIGLYLVKTLVDQYGGEIRVEDRADWSPPDDEDDETSGTVFTVQLPKA